MLTLDISSELCKEFAEIQGWTIASGITIEDFCTNKLYEFLKDQIIYRRADSSAEAARSAVFLTAKTNIVFPTIA